MLRHVLALLALFLFNPIFACEECPYKLGNPSKDWVVESLKLHPEIFWLADAQVRHTEEGIASFNGSFSEKLFGQKFIEFDRTLMTLHCLNLILIGDEAAYHEFTEGQEISQRLTPASFLILHKRAKQLLDSNKLGLSSDEMIQVMQAALVLGDIGKSEKARSLFKPYGPSAPDHDDYYGELLKVFQKHPELSPTFQRLKESAKDLLCKAANLAHYGHITHLEGMPSMFVHIKENLTSETASSILTFDLFVHACDVMGALGHVNSKSSLVYTENTHRALEAVFQACHLLSDQNKTVQDAYFDYLNTRASWLGLNVQNKEGVVLTRIGAMLRLFTQEDGKNLKAAFQKIQEPLREKILTYLEVSPNEPFGRTPTYMPLVFINLFNHFQTKISKEVAIQDTLQVGLPFIAAVLERQKQAIMENSNKANIPLNFNKVSGIAKTTPEKLLISNFIIEDDGNISLK